MRIKMEQCDGTIRFYDQKPWWLNEPVQKQRYREDKGHITKAMKISATMSKIRELNEHKRVERLLGQGIVIRQNENGVVVIRNVAQKLERV